MIEKRNEMTERGANRRKVIETNAAIFKKVKDIAVNYESLKERYEKDRKKRIVSSAPRIADIVEKAVSRGIKGPSRSRSRRRAMRDRRPWRSTRP